MSKRGWWFLVFLVGSSGQCTDLKQELRELDLKAGFNQLFTVAGIDRDKNGVRDDVDAHIKALPDSSEQKLELTNLSRVIQEMMLNNKDKPKLYSLAQEGMRITFCLGDLYPDVRMAVDRNDDIEDLTVNTRQRWMAYDIANTNLSGTSTVAPRNPCNKQ